MNQKFEELQKVITNLDDQGLKKELASIIDSYTGERLLQGLKEKFGERNFKVSIKNDFKPSLGKHGGEYKYYIEHISWDGNAPNPHQVFFYIKENFGAYLKSMDFDRRIFTRRLQGIERKYISWFVPLPINGAEFNAFEVMLTRIENKVNDKVTLVYFVAEAKDKKLNISVKDETLEGVLTRIQEKVEDVYYSPVYSPERQHLVAKYERVADIKMEEEEEETK